MEEEDSSPPWLLYSKAWLLPILTVCLIPSGFTLTYAWSVNNGHLAPAFAFISETGEREPENFAFAILFNGGVCLLSLTLLIRWDFIRVWERRNPAKRPKAATVLNYSVLGIGLLAAFSGALVANVTATADLRLHLVGLGGLSWGFAAAMSGICGQSCCQNRRWIPPWLQICRLVLTVIVHLFVVTMFGTMADAGESISQSYSGNGDYLERGLALKNGEPRRLAKGTYGYRATLICVVSEWGFAVSMAVFFLTLVPELWRLKEGTRGASDKTERLPLQPPQGP